MRRIQTSATYPKRSPDLTSTGKRAGYQGLPPESTRTAAGRAVYRSPPSGVQAKNGGATPLLPHTSSWCGS
jgi:hypothetical protein